MAVKHAAAGAGAGAVLTALLMNTVTPLLNRVEGVRHVPYYDVVHVLTVCVGHTGPDVRVKHVYSQPECDALTEKDTEKAAAGVLKVSPQLEYHPMQLAAAISFSYNVGIGGYAHSSVARNFNAGNYKAGCKALFKYEYAKGRYIQGLANRRQQEYKVCMSSMTPKGMPDATSTTGPTR